MRLPTGRRLAGRRRPAAVRQNSPLSETDNLVECAPGGGQITGWELTEAAGLSKDGSHGQAPHSQHWAAQEWNRSSQRLVRTLGSLAMPVYSRRLDMERNQIPVMRVVGRSISTIATALRRAKSTVSRVRSGAQQCVLGSSLAGQERARRFRRSWKGPVRLGPPHS